MKRSVVLFLSLCVAIVVPACSSKTETENSGKDARKELRLAFVTNNSADFWTIARRGVESSKRLGRHRWVVVRTQS